MSLPAIHSKTLKFRRSQEKNANRYRRLLLYLRHYKHTMKFEHFVRSFKIHERLWELCGFSKKRDTADQNRPSYFEYSMQSTIEFGIYLNDVEFIIS